MQAQKSGRRAEWGFMTYEKSNLGHGGRATDGLQGRTRCCRSCFDWDRVGNESVTGTNQDDPGLGAAREGRQEKYRIKKFKRGYSRMIRKYNVLASSFDQVEAMETTCGAVRWRRQVDQIRREQWLLLLVLVGGLEDNGTKARRIQMRFGCSAQRMGPLLPGPIGGDTVDGKWGPSTRRGDETRRRGRGRVDKTAGRR